MPQREGVRFETRALKPGAGDYQLVLADGPQAMGAMVQAAREVVLPRLIERKSTHDVAASLRDGRWDKQQRSMDQYNASAFGGRAAG